MEGLDADQARMIQGALSIGSQKVSGIMTDIYDVEYLTMDCVMDQAALKRV